MCVCHHLMHVDLARSQSGLRTALHCTDANVWIQNTSVRGGDNLSCPPQSVSQSSCAVPTAAVTLRDTQSYFCAKRALVVAVKGISQLRPRLRLRIRRLDSGRGHSTSITSKLSSKLWQIDEIAFNFLYNFFLFAKNLFERNLKIRWELT